MKCEQCGHEKTEQEKLQAELLDLIARWREDNKPYKPSASMLAMLEKGRASVRELHRRAVQKADYAGAAGRHGNHELAITLFREAYELETKAAIEAREFPDGDLTYGMLAINAGYYAQQETQHWFRVDGGCK